ncbi:MAG: GvpL/GvpF family gas vesicle protein [Gemmatimonadota bacterium]
MARTRSLRIPAIGAEALQLFGIVNHDAAAPVRVTDVEVVPLRELAAIVHRVPYERVEATTAAIKEYREIVEARFREQTVIPAPFGTVFRSRSSLLHWMELHYVTLKEGFRFVGDRLMARLRVTPIPLPPEGVTDTREMQAADFETTVFDSFRFLKRNAVACVTFAPQSTPSGKSVEASFLVEREKWESFHDAVGEERRRLSDLAIEQSEPLPPYDFVRLRFGA